MIFAIQRKKILQFSSSGNFCFKFHVISSFPWPAQQEGPFIPKITVSHWDCHPAQITMQALTVKDFFAPLKMPFQLRITEGTTYPANRRVCFVGWLLNVPATCECISGTDLLRQFYVLPHWDRSCRSNVLPHPVTVYWHRADQSQHWPYNARRLAG